MPIIVNFQGRQPITQDINNDYEIDYNPDVFNSVRPKEDYVNRFISNYETVITTLRKQNISNLPDYTTAVYFGIELNNIDVDTIKRIKEINEEEKKEINEEETDNGEPCINMIKYTRICDLAIMPYKSIINLIREFDSAIIPYKSIINLIREFDSEIIPCKSIINLIRQIDSQIVKNQLSAIPQKPVVTQIKPKKPLTGPLDSLAISQKPVVTQIKPKK